MPLYQPQDFLRVTTDSVSPDTLAPSPPYRSEFRRDFGRLVHSPSFRRLQGKTQLYPSHENDYFRTRLTHSIEVAQIAKSIALKLNYERNLNLDTDLVEFAALAHDIGHPPFGHQGEEALDEEMKEFGGFEGNAQTLRIITRLEKKLLPNKIFVGEEDVRVGLDLTYRTIASILKYDQVIPESLVEREHYSSAKGDNKIEPVKGYYKVDDDIAEIVKKNVLNGYELAPGEKFKTIECRIMDISDDIAYSTYDLDDTLKANFCNPFDIVFAEDEIVDAISKKASKSFDQTITSEKVRDTLYKIFGRIFEINPEVEKEKITQDEIKPENLSAALRYFHEIHYKASRDLANDGYLRNRLTTRLIDHFISGVEYVPHLLNPALSKVFIKDEIRIEVEVLKLFNYEVNILSSRLKIPAYRGKQIVQKIFEILSFDGGYMLLPNDYKEVFIACPNEKLKRRTICDFIAGMTDKYCIEFYARLMSENAETIFKPI